MYKSISIWRWLLAISFGLVLWSFCIVSVIRATKKLTDLTKLTSRLDSVTVEQGMGRSKPYYVVFNLANSSCRPGIFLGVNKANAEQLASRFTNGDELTIYYDASGLAVERHVNLFTYQVQNKSKIIFSLMDAQRQNWPLVIMFGLLAFLYTLIASVGFYKQISNSQSAT